MWPSYNFHGCWPSCTLYVSYIITLYMDFPRCSIWASSRDGAGGRGQDKGGAEPWRLEGHAGGTRRMEWSNVSGMSPFIAKVRIVIDQKKTWHFFPLSFPPSLSLFRSPLSLPPLNCLVHRHCWFYSPHCRWWRLSCQLSQQCDVSY